MIYRPFRAASWRERLACWLLGRRPFVANVVILRGSALLPAPGLFRPIGLHCCAFVHDGAVLPAEGVAPDVRDRAAELDRELSR